MTEDLVTAYWEQWRLARGDRQERLAAEHADDWAGDAVAAEVEEGDPSVVSLLVALAEGAPTDEDAGTVGAGPLEELLVRHGQRMAQPAGSELLEAVDAAARTSAAFRRALRSVWVGDEVPQAVCDRLFRFFRNPPK